MQNRRADLLGLDKKGSLARRQHQRQQRVAKKNKNITRSISSWLIQLQHQNPRLGELKQDKQQEQAAGAQKSTGDWCGGRRKEGDGGSKLGRKLRGAYLPTNKSLRGDKFNSSSKEFPRIELKEGRLLRQAADNLNTQPRAWPVVNNGLTRDDDASQDLRWRAATEQQQGCAGLCA